GGPSHADPADRRVLLGAEGAGRPRRDAALQRRVPRDGIEAVQLHAHPALHDELVPEVPPGRRGGGDRGGESVGPISSGWTATGSAAPSATRARGGAPLARRAATPPSHRSAPGSRPASRDPRG